MKRIFVVVVVFCLIGCAQTPDVSVKYHPPQTSVDVTVTRTIGCDFRDFPVIASSVTATSMHSANTKVTHEVALSGLHSSMSDSDIKFDFYDDGRLKGVNATSTGQGEQIIKSVISLIPFISGFEKGAESPFATECAFIKTHGDGKPLTLTFNETITDLKPVRTQKIPVNLKSKYYFQNVGKAMGFMCLNVAAVAPATAPVSVNSDKGKNEKLKLTQPSLTTLEVKKGTDENCKTLGDKIWSGQLLVAQNGAPYDVPLPRATSFGSQTFAITLDGSGAVTHLQYAKNTGANQLVASGQSVLGAFQAQSNADKATATKAQADLIYHQQRLVECETDPKNCIAP